MSNRIKLADIDKMAVGDIAKLPIDQLVMLVEDAQELADQAKRYNGWLNGAVAIRYADRAATARRDAGKDTGIVHLADGEFDVECDLPKKVEWDQDKLTAAFDAMTRSEADHYCKATLEVAEAKYNAAPPHIKALLTPARTVKAGKPKFTLAKKE
jgi:hypothetical protein